ncbi:hypothetical protein BC835DRAFT_775239 [Cytidiella melzeri]|nr:hypothetical protein BC835DRAFT_775239 [Cytidiella melzeri]
MVAQPILPPLISQLKLLKVQRFFCGLVLSASLRQLDLISLLYKEGIRYALRRAWRPKSDPAPVLPHAWNDVPHRMPFVTCPPHTAVSSSKDNTIPSHDCSAEEKCKVLARSTVHAALIRWQLDAFGAKSYEGDRGKDCMKSRAEQRQQR